MQLSDHQKKSALIALAVFFVVLALIVVAFNQTPEVQAEGALVPLGTNQLAVGANLYLANGYHFGRVVKIDQGREFPDGTNRPGALIKPTNTFAVWVPLEKLTNALVVQ